MKPVMKQVDFSALLLEAIPDAVVVADMESRIVYANASVEKLLGWRADDLVGQSLHLIQPERMHAPHDVGFGRYARAGSPTLFGTPIRVPARRSDGTERDIELNLAEILDRSGQRLVLGVLRDLSERVELERNLAILHYLRATTSAAARLWTRLDPPLVLQTLTDVLVDDFDAALARTWILEPDLKTLRMVTSGGLSTRVADSPRERIDVETHAFKIGVVARTRKPFIRNDIAGDPDFDQAWVAAEGIHSVICLPLVAGDQLLGAMVSFFRHPTPDEVAETIGHLASLAAAALNDAHLVEQERDARSVADRARQRFETLAKVSEQLGGSLDPEVTAQAVADCVVPAFADWCVIDLQTDGNALQAVARAHRHPGRLERIRELRMRYPPGLRTQPRHAIYRVLDSGRTVAETVSDSDLAERAADDEHLALLRELGIGSHVVVPLLARGRAMGTISLVRAPDRDPFDAEEALTAEDIGRRTALAIDNARLYRATQQAVQLRDQFLAVASHELRTPLSVVKGHWELLVRRLEQETGDSDAHRERVNNSLRRLGQGIHQLQRLVEDLLDVNRLRGGSVQLQRTEVDLAGLVRDTVAGAYDADTRKRIRLEVPKAPVTGLWDGARLGQLIGNLLNNALKYSPSDGRVELELSEPGEEVRIRVSDSGIGIPADQLETIFEPFSRATNASAPGMGLGLSVSREIVGQLGGRMWAESAGEGKGSSFFVELDRGPEAEDAASSS